MREILGRRSGPRPEPIKIDPAWFPVSEACPERAPEPEEDAITLKPGERVPVEAGALLRTFYAPGIGDMRVHARLDPDRMAIDPELVLGPDDVEAETPAPEKTPKSPK